MTMQNVSLTRTEFEQYLALPENADRRFELINGTVIEKNLTTLRAVLLSTLTFHLGIYVEAHKRGWVLVSADYALVDDPLNYRMPDLSYRIYAKGDLTQIGAAPFMPDLAIEIQSPGQSDKFMADKADYYLKKGSRMVWLVYSTKRLIEVLTPTERHLLTEYDTLDGGDVLPGFTLRVGEVFPS